MGRLNAASPEGWIGQAPGPFDGEEALRQWCSERNAWAASMGADWWWKVIFRTMESGGKRAEVIKLEGMAAVEARSAAEGKPIVPWKPTPEETAEIQAKVAKLIASGMTQAEFNRLVDQGRF